MTKFRFEAWPTEYRTIVQYFGANPEAYAPFGLPGHDGVDIRATQGSKIFAVAPGLVERVQATVGDSAYGIHVRVAHADGYETIYGHLEKTLVREGNRVQAGTILGLAGSTGNSTGPHLHLGLKRKGESYGNWPFNFTDPTPFLLPLLSWQQPAGPFTEGWVVSAAVTVVGGMAQVNTGDAHLRENSEATSEVIDLIPAGTILLVTGTEVNGSLPVRVPTSALDSAPVVLPPPQPEPGSVIPEESIVLAWAWQEFLDTTGRYAMVGRHGVNLRSAPTRLERLLGQMQWGHLVTLVGPSINGFAPIFAHKADVLNLRLDGVNVQEPKPWPAEPNSAGPAVETVPGWVLTAHITGGGATVVAGREGANIRALPKRNGRLVGYVPLGTKMEILGPATGEYTPVKVPVDALQTVEEAGDTPLPNPDPQPLGKVAIGLHASADPDISEAELIEFSLLRPSIIKVLSFHNPQGLRKLAANHQQAQWIVRTFLDFGSRSLNPQTFFNDTIGDLLRTLKILEGRDVVVELHNEPNLFAEGLGASWTDGSAFTQWWLRLLKLYRYALPDQRFIFPGLSPGPDTAGQRQDHVRFLEASRTAVTAADGLGVHIYWSRVYPMQRALEVLDDYVKRFPNTPIWVTEASNNQNGTTAVEKAHEYLAFWKELQARPSVQGVTYFVASASNPQFATEVFVGRGLARIIGAR